MTNNNYHFIELDDQRYSIATPFIFAEMTDDDALGIMRSTMLALAPKVAADAARIANNDFSDDDTDYMPARSAALAALIYSLANTDELPAAALNRLLHDYDFILDIMTTDIPELPIDIDYAD